MSAQQAWSALQRLALAGAATSLLATVAGAATLDFDFAFENLAVAGGGTVTGVIRGVQDNTTAAASSVEVLTNVDGFGIGEYVGNPAQNSWTVEDGAITAFDFLVFGNSNTAPFVTEASLRFLVSEGDWSVGLLPSGGSALASLAAGDTLTFTLRADPPAVIPLPGAAWLLLGALGAVAGLGAARRRL